MNNKKGLLIYRCRRCGEFIQFSPVNHLPAAAKAICLTGTVHDVMGRQEFIMRPHTCSDGHVGITDIVGGEYLENDEVGEPVFGQNQEVAKKKTTRRQKK